MHATVRKTLVYKFKPLLSKGWVYVSDSLFWC